MGQSLKFIVGATKWIISVKFTPLEIWSQLLTGIYLNEIKKINKVKRNVLNTIEQLI